MIRELEALAKLPPACRDDIERYCSLRGITYGSILSGDKRSADHMERVKGLLLHINGRGYSLKDLCIATGLKSNTALEILEGARKPDFRIKTSNWDRVSSCRQ